MKVIELSLYFIVFKTFDRVATICVNEFCFIFGISKYNKNERIHTIQDTMFTAIERYKLHSNYISLKYAGVRDIECVGESKISNIKQFMTKNCN